MHARPRSRGVFDQAAKLMCGFFLTASLFGGESLSILAGRLLDVETGAVLENQEIRVTDGLITSISPQCTAIARSSGETIDLNGSFVLPGLIDCHTHLTLAFDEGWEDQPVRESPAEMALRGARNARIMLHSGFTTVREVGALFFADIALMRAIDKGWIEGPRMFPSGHNISITGGHGDIGGFVPGVQELGPEQGIADGVDQVMRAVRYQIKHGAKAIKFMATAGVMSYGRSAIAQQFSDAEMRAISDEAHRHGLKAAAHAHGVNGIKAAVLAGVDSIEHGAKLDEETVALMRARGTYLVPTLFLPDWAVTIAPTNLFPAEVRQKMGLNSELEKARKRMILTSGVKIAFGSDMGDHPLGQSAKEFSSLVEYGLTPLQAIQSATTHAADLLGESNRLGALKAGFVADIIAVAGNPLTNIAVLEKTEYVMKEGKTMFRKNANETAQLHEIKN